MATPKRSMTPASPKCYRVKASEPGVPLFGCGLSIQISQYCSQVTDLSPEHLQRFFSQSQEVTNRTIHHYKVLLQYIFDNNPLQPQTSVSFSHEDWHITSLTPNYLCLQCSTTSTDADRSKHSAEKLHRFCMQLFCYIEVVLTSW